MTTRRFDPLRDMLSLQERMNRLFEDSLSSMRPASPFAGGSWTPMADVYETADAYVVHVDLPGLDPGDVEVSVDGDRLTIRGERRPKGGTRPDAFLRMERSYGPFSRSFALRPEVDPDRVTAHFRDGLLRLDLPKARPFPPWKGRAERGTD